jgi:hypothetical protein
LQEKCANLGIYFSNRKSPRWTAKLHSGPGNSGNGSADEGFGFGLDGFEVVGAVEGFGVDFVDVFGAGGAVNFYRGLWPELE